jgi:ribonuclease-3
VSDVAYRSLSDLTWEAIGIEKRIGDILVDIQASIDEIPENHTRTQSKFRRWLKELHCITTLMKQIRTGLSVDLERVFGHDFADDELLLVTMFQPSTRNLFLEIKTHYESITDREHDSKNLDDLISISDMAKTLALVGDAAISMAVLHHLWRPDVETVGHLTQRRSEIVSNENLARVCDRFQLYEHRIHFDPITPTKSETEHIKGTLIEAVYGIMYIRYGLERVRELVTLIIETLE